MELFEFVREIHKEVLENKTDDININLRSSISKKKKTKNFNRLTQNKLKKNKPKSPVKIITRNPSLIFETPKYKYTTIRISDNLYYSIEKWGYIFLTSKNFIPNRSST